MIVKRAELARFGITSEQYDDFFEQIQALKETDPQFEPSGRWICNAMRICPHVLSDLIDAGAFPPPIRDD